jgi:hypothetical protein
MPRKGSAPTVVVERQITAFIRAGGFAHVAAEAAGVAREVFEEWLRHADKPRASPRYRRFAAAVRLAVAQARLRAETTALEEKAMDWLKSGPGKETGDSPGWTAPMRANQRPADPVVSALQHADLQPLFAAMLDVLTLYPAARQALAEAVERMTSPPKPGSKRGL